MSPQARSLLPLLGLAAAGASLALAQVLSRLAFTNGVTVITASTSRSVCAAVLLALVLAARGPQFVPLVRGWRPALALGAFLAAQTAFLQFSVKQMPVAVAVLVFYTYPFFTALASAALGDVRFGWRLGASLAAAFVGLALVLRIGAHPVDLLGVALGLGAAISFAATLVLTPRLAPLLPAPVRTLYMLTTAGVLFVGASFATGAFHLPENPAGWTGLAGMCLFYSAGIVGMFLVLPRLGATQTALVLNLEPVIVALVATLTLGELLALPQWTGVALVVASILFFQLTGRR